MRKTVGVVVDGVERRLAAGMTVRHLLSPDQLERVRAGTLRVEDERGNERGLGGALCEGAVVNLVPRPKP